MRRLATTGCVCLALALHATAALAAATPGSGDGQGQRVAPLTPFLLWYMVDDGGGVSSAPGLVLMGAVVDDISTPLLSLATSQPTPSANVQNPVETEGLPTELALAPISPNPARGLARVSWALPAESTVRIAVHDVQGREVAVLADGSYAPGRYSVTWHPERHEAAGVYFVRLQAMGKALVRRLAVTP